MVFVQYIDIKYVYDAKKINIMDNCVLTKHEFTCIMQLSNKGVGSFQRLFFILENGSQATGIKMICAQNLMSQGHISFTDNLYCFDELM